MILALCGCGGGGQGASPDDRALWKFDTGKAIYYGSPALSRDEETVYVGTSYWTGHLPGTGHALYAFDASRGTVKWRYELGEREVRSSPAIGEDNAIYVVVERRDIDDVLCRFSASGSLVWEHPIGSGPQSGVGLSSPAIGPDGTVYVCADGLFAINPDNSLKWHRPHLFGEDMKASPSVGRNGTVYVAYHNPSLSAHDPATGNPLWSFAGNYMLTSPGIGPDGTVYAGSDDGRLYAFDPSSGSIRWSYDASSAIRSSPAVGPDNTIYFGTQGNPLPKLTALNPNGTLRWQFVPGVSPPGDSFDIYSSPAVGADNTVYFGLEFGYVFALDGRDGSIRWQYEIRDAYPAITWSSPVIRSDGILYIGNLFGTLFALKSESRGLAPSSWPRFRHDNQGTGGALPAP